MRRLFTGVFGGFCLMIAGIGLYNYTHFNKIHGIQEELVRIDRIAQVLQDHKTEMQQLGQHNVLFDSISMGGKNALVKSESYWKSIDKDLRYFCQQAASKNLECVLQESKDVRKMLREDEQQIIVLASKIGFKESGLLGRLRKKAHSMEENFPNDRERLLSFRRHEKDFLMRIDPAYGEKINDELSEWQKQESVPEEAITYVSIFDTLSKEYLKLYSNDPQGAYFSWTTNFEQLYEAIRRQRTIILQESFRESDNAGLINLLNNLAAVLLAFACTIFFIRRFSKQVTGLQQSMGQYIASNYQYSDNMLKKIPKNEFGKITTHFLQLTRKIKSDVHLLEDRVARRTQALEIKNTQLERQQKEIRESLEYSRDLQQSFLVSRSKMLRHFNEAAVYYNPKDLVGGDFYWMKTVKKPKVDLVYFALADCTGHGVPGALLSIMGMNALDELIDRDLTSPADLLNEMRMIVTRRLNSDYHMRYDGMDMALFCWNRKTNELTVSGAQMPVWVLGSELKEMNGQRMPIGYTFFETTPFADKVVMLEPGDRILLFTDGITDQFGGINDKKLGKQRLRELLITNKNLSSDNLSLKIASYLDHWRGGGEQTDDCSFVIVEPLAIPGGRKLVLQRQEGKMLV